MTETITYTMSITFFIILSMQECGCDGVCGPGALQEMGPFQVNPGVAAGQMAKLGCEDINWWSFDESIPCVHKFLDWNEDAQYCPGYGWTLAAYNWGIGNVRWFQDKYGCNMRRLRKRYPHVWSFAQLERGLMCWNERRDEWISQECNPKDDDCKGGELVGGNRRTGELLSYRGSGSDLLGDDGRAGIGVYPGPDLRSVVQDGGSQDEQGDEASPDQSYQLLHLPLVAKVRLHDATDEQFEGESERDQWLDPVSSACCRWE